MRDRKNFCPVLFMTDLSYKGQFHKGSSMRNSDHIFVRDPPRIQRIGTHGRFGKVKEI